MNKIATKPTIIQRVWAFFDDQWATILLVLFVSFVIYLFYLMATAEPAKYIKAPLDHCVQTYTGQTKVDEYYTYVCVSFNKDGVCTNQMPVLQQDTYRAVNVKCDWTEWRLQ